jgi:hypothetical protein
LRATVRAILSDEFADDTFRLATGVVVRTIDRIQTCVACHSHHFARDSFIGLIAEHQ